MLGILDEELIELVVVLARNFSDHCPILLKTLELNFSPIPFKFFDHWLHEEGFCQMIETQWQQICVSGCASYRFKEKLKLLKIGIKKWRHENPIATTARRDELKEEMNAWDLRAEKETLSPDEANQLRAARNEYYKAEKEISSSLKQKARLRWAIDGDENTKFFHGLVKGRYKKNYIKGLNINGIWIEDPLTLKKEIRLFFKDHFT